jgi:tight adherence protein C
LSTTTVIVFGLLAALGIVAAFWGMSRPTASTGEMVQERLQAYGGERPLTLEEIELQRPFSERLIRPTMERLAKALGNRTPDRAREDLEGQLALAGRPGNLSASEFIALRYALLVIGGIIGLALGWLVSGQGSSPGWVLGLGGAGAAIGLFFPILYIRQKVQQRKRRIQVALPDALDLLTICVEAGLGFDAALARVTDKFTNALAAEFGQVLQEVRLGRSRLDALDAMGRRCKVEDLHNFIQAIIQSEQMGVGIAKILRLQSEEIRRKRRQRAQEKAAQASLKMMLPMIGCIFPTLWIILLGPAALVLIHSRST